MSRKEKTWWWIAGVAILVYCLFPIAWIVSVSFKPPADLVSGGFLPDNATLGNYRTILTGNAKDLFLPALRNSFGICLIATAISCLLSMFAAYAIARLEIGLGSAVSVLLFLAVVLIAALFIKGFKVDLAGTRGDS